MTGVTEPQLPGTTPISTTEEVKTLMPYDSYRLHQTERAKSLAEVQRADKQAAWLVAVGSSLLRAITRQGRAARRPYARPQRAAYAAKQDYGAAASGRG